MKWVVLVLLLGIVTPVQAQETGGEAQYVALGGPRFLDGTGPGAKPIEVASVAALQRRVTLTAAAATLGDALRAITRQTGVRFLLSPEVVPVTKPVRVEATGLSIAAALTELLLNTEVDVAVTSATELALVRRRGGTPETGTVAGRVTDGTTGEAVLTAEVYLERTRWRTTTGEDGRYRLPEVGVGAYTLTVRRIGYAKQSRPVTVVSGEEVTVDLALGQVATQLNEIVTTVTGDQRRVELGHVVGRINADSVVKEAPITTLTELLTARVPGLQVFQAQGTVGGDVRLQIRGVNSLALNSEPIVIVDGVRFSTARTSGGTAMLFEPSSRLNDINPNDIATVEVVKGPSAATLYGTDAANGVILITTKRGEAGRTRWTAYGRAMRTGIPATSFAPNYWAWGSTTLNCQLVFVADGTCTQDSITVVPNSLNDPRTSVLGSEGSWEYGTAVSGGGDNLRYYLSGSHTQQQGPLRLPPDFVARAERTFGVSELRNTQLHPNTDHRTNIQGNVDLALSGRANVSFSAGYQQGSTRSLALGEGYLSAFGAADPTSSKGTADFTELVFSSSSTEDLNRFQLSGTGSFRPRDWLELRGTAGIDLGNVSRFSLQPRLAELGPFYGGTVEDERTRTLTTTANLSATATARAGRVSFRTTAGAQYVRDRSDGVVATGSGLEPGGSSVQQAPFRDGSQSLAESVTLGGFLEEELGLNDRLFLTTALRVDGASGFGRDYDATVYPKAGASWLASEEPFFPRLPGLDELRLRYAFGASGQQALPTMRRPLLETGSTLDDAGEPGTSIFTSTLGNVDLRPERVREHEFGFDANLLSSRLQLEASWYYRTTRDALHFIVGASGIPGVWQNLGLLRDNGFEARVVARVVESRLVSWDLGLQHNADNSRLIDVGGGRQQWSRLGGFVENYPIGARFMTPIAGFGDANGNGILEPSEVQMGTQPVYVGRSTPPHTQTLTTTLGLFDRRVRASALVERRSGFTQIDHTKEIQCGVQRNCPAALDPSTPLAEQAEVQAYALAAVGYADAFHTFVEPGSFVRLREVSLAIDLPARVLRFFRVTGGTLTLSGRNLALWSSFKGPDPESVGGWDFDSSPGGPTGGVKGGAVGGVPQARVWTARFDLAF
ncbi:MAG TPA: TonB-dependent receptor plug domain-containing protein [Gemmatimonadales bacterium]|nr:TonB-dependent receptor plug domain-containing protein [Gemmatimonadales bacterium]